MGLNIGADTQWIVDTAIKGLEMTQYRTECQYVIYAGGMRRGGGGGGGMNNCKRVTGSCVICLNLFKGKM